MEAGVLLTLLMVATTVSSSSLIHQPPAAAAVAWQPASSDDTATDDGRYSNVLVGAHDLSTAAYADVILIRGTSAGRISRE